jgi:spore coat-associated protein S
MATQVAGALAAFGLSDARVRLESDKEKKPVWQVRAGGQTLFLKRMAMTEDRLRFVVAAVAHLRRNGVLLPELLTGPNNQPYAAYEGGLYTLTAGAPGRKPDYRNDLPLLMRSLARFHAGGRGFQPPAQIAVQTLLGHWPHHIANKRAELAAFRTRATTEKSRFARVFLAGHAEIVAQVAACERVLAEGEYEAWVARVAAEGCICHQDYASSNLRVDQGRVWVLDVDSLAIDLPARDLRKILYKVMKKEGCDRAHLASALAAYQEVYPLTAAERRVVAADLQFPHLALGVANRYFTGRTTGEGDAAMAQKLQDALAVERSKREVVAWLLGG